MGPELAPREIVRCPVLNSIQRFVEATSTAPGMDVILTLDEFGRHKQVICPLYEEDGQRCQAADNEQAVYSRLCTESGKCLYSEHEGLKSLGKD